MAKHGDACLLAAIPLVVCLNNIWPARCTTGLSLMGQRGGKPLVR